MKTLFDFIGLKYSEVLYKTNGSTETLENSIFTTSMAQHEDFHVINDNQLIAVGVSWASILTFDI